MIVEYMVFVVDSNNNFLQEDGSWGDDGMFARMFADDVRARKVAEEVGGKVHVRKEIS